MPQKGEAVLCQYCLNVCVDHFAALPHREAIEVALVLLLKASWTPHLGGSFACPTGGGLGEDPERAELVGEPLEVTPAGRWMSKNICLDHCSHDQATDKQDECIETFI